MAKKAEPKKKRADKYEEKFAVNGSFKDLMKAVVKDAAAKKPTKKKVGTQ